MVLGDWFVISDLISTKELWSITAKHGATQNKIYGFSGSLSTPYVDEESPAMCIFTVESNNKKEIGFIFNNGSDDVHSWKLIMDHIGGGHRKHLVYPDDWSAIKNIVLSLYNGQPLNTKHGKSKVIMSKPLYVMDDGTETEIYDFRIGNLYPSTERVPIYRNGYLAHEGNDIRAHFKGKSFFTEYDPLLYAGLCSSVVGWKLNYGTREKEKQRDNPMLVCMVSDFTENVAISFAEIVYQFHHHVNGLSLIDPRKDGIGFARMLIQNHRDMMDAGLVCDHLTEDRLNNFSWALAMIPNNFNATFGERSAIAKPWYFYTIWDKKSFLYRVEFGFDDGTLHEEHRYSFVTLYEQTESKEYLYKKLFSSFCKRIGVECAHTDGDTYLRYWGNPEHAHNANNPLIAMREKPAELYLYVFSPSDDDRLGALSGNSRLETDINHSK